MILALQQVRPAIVAALADAPWMVHGDLPDAVQPPCLVVTWSNQWLEVQTACNYRASATVICVANRLTPGTGLELLEDQVAYVVRTLAETMRASIPAIPGPQQLDISGVTYLTARVPVVLPVTVAQLVEV